METISIPIEGALDHRDSLGNHRTVLPGQIQVMSTGSGVQHSEYNKNCDKPVHFLQIWIIPNRNDTEPRYQHIDLKNILIYNQLNVIVKPSPGDASGAWIRQQAWLSQGKLGRGREVTYTMKSPQSYGVYLFMIRGEVSIDDDIELSCGDGLGILNAPPFRIKALLDTDVLLIEVPRLK